MKIENISQNVSNNDDTALTLALLSHRIGDELCDLVNICRNVENALGVVIGTPKEEIDQPIMAIQGLDRLRQTLEDLARLSRLIARLQAFSNDEIPKQDVLRTVILTGLASRLTRSEVTGFGEEQNLQDVIWK